MPASVTTIDQLARARRDLKQYRSIVEMMKGNTDVQSIKQLEQLWLVPLQERIQDLEAKRERSFGTSI